MEYPIPSHLRAYFQVAGSDNNELQVHGTLACTCRHAFFRVSESNERRLVVLTCPACGKEIVLFDEGKHGWNGFVCHDDFIDREEPPVKSVCPVCQGDEFAVSVTVRSQGKQDFLETCVEDDDSFSPEDWADGFEWITVGLCCENCGIEDGEWMDLETM